MTDEPHGNGRYHMASALTSQTIVNQALWFIVLLCMFLIFGMSFGTRFARNEAATRALKDEVQQLKRQINTEK